MTVSCSPTAMPIPWQTSAPIITRSISKCFVPGPGRTEQEEAPGLDYVFHPRSMAVAGLSPDPHGTWLNQVYFDSPLKMGFKGPLYPINPKGGRIGSFQVYPSLKDVPGPVDHVVSCIPARHTPTRLEDSRDSGVKVVQLYTAGFAETGEPEGIELQNRLVEIARSGGI